MALINTCEKCRTGKHTTEEHKIEVRRQWYIDNNHNEKMKLRQRERRGALKFYKKQEESAC